MADRIVVMKDGAIEQVGTPAEIYGRPATPFVADFVGKTNLLPATHADEGHVQVGPLRFACAIDGAAAREERLRLFFRPEDVVVRGVNVATPNSAPATVEKVEFLGAFSRVTLRISGIEQPLFADMSVNDIAELAPAPGRELRVAVPPERLRVFG
jgi:iron(III) transport system ATP-binding protein